MPLDPRLLLATEDLALSRTLSWVLKENGYDVVTASGRPQLAERLDQEEYDLLVLDVDGGDVGALDRLSPLRNDPRSADLPLLVLADAEVTAGRGMRAGRGSATDVGDRGRRLRVTCPSVPVNTS